jgi:hypothetical protein
MKYALNLADDGRILSVTFEKYADKGSMPIVEELPEGNVADYRYVESEYIYDPKPKEPDPAPPVPDDASVWDELDAAYQEGVDSV